MIVTEPVLHRIFEICAHSKTQEDGGRLIGFRSGNAISVVELLPSGPKSQKTAASLFQDGYWQRKLYRKIESEFPEIEVLGSFHHHISAGNYPTLSCGDIASYRHFLSDPDFGCNYFVSILVYDIPAHAIDFIKDIDLYAVGNLIFHDKILVERIEIADAASHLKECQAKTTEIINQFSAGNLAWYERSPIVYALRSIIQSGAEIRDGGNYLRIAMNEAEYILHSERPLMIFQESANGITLISSSDAELKFTRVLHDLL